MAITFGVRSDCAANTRLKNGYDLFSWAMRSRGIPTFWGRSISGMNKVTKEELEFLKAKDCKVVLIFDDLTENEVASVNGTIAATRAAISAKELGVPADGTVAIFAAIKDDWNVNLNWLICYASELKLNGYIPGFIGNTDSSDNFNFDRQCGHFVNAGYNAIYWATQPKRAPAPMEWTPYCPSVLNPEDISFWQNDDLAFDSLAYQSVYARDDKALSYAWDYTVKEAVSDDGHTV